MDTFSARNVTSQGECHRPIVDGSHHNSLLTLRIQHDGEIQMKSNFRRALLASTLFVVPLSAGQATQITAGPSAQPVTFTRTPTGLHITSPSTVDLTAFDTTQSILGGAWFINLDFTTGNETNGHFTPAPNEFTFKYQAGDNYVLERVSAIDVQDDTTQPKIFGIGTTVESAGNPEFLSAFPIGGHDNWDFITNDLGITLTNLIGSASASISTLEKTPNTLVPEPSFIWIGNVLFSLGAIAFAYLFRSRRRENYDIATAT